MASVPRRIRSSYTQHGMWEEKDLDEDEVAESKGTK